ncbi:RluA family pseudouridine synthase [Paenibacillus flagellatus]|uniref:Pseudouridine synthase n=1 Tax=Paenibacillus flagellatus TaxID=2211139 RepID=A0A2V5JZD0_9BACL|nr:RluA family pseudouridine synthase [Paenibacillus flagellatus]PYI51662.1 RluA family pseudouridine synthase [Paenibacillus flagellatus]
MTAERPAELLAFLLDAFAGKGRNAVKSILARGQVSVNGVTVTRHDHPLLPGHRVAVSWTKVADESRFFGLSILHEDDDVIVVNKEAGLLSVATDKEKEVTAYRQLMEHVRRTDPRSRIFVVHRLDRDTSGVMMFAKSERVQQQLQNDWQDAVEERTYVALVEGQVRDAEGTIRSWLKENKAMRVYSSPKPDDGQLAVTHYKTVKSSKDFTLLEVSLETGRKNQIRVHMQDIGHPVVGDKKYGARTNAIGRLGLHARVLSFRHPTSGRTVRFESKVPPAFLRVFKE